MKSPKTLVIKPDDKGSGTVLWDINKYKAEAGKQPSQSYWDTTKSANMSTSQWHKREQENGILAITQNT